MSLRRLQIFLAIGNCLFGIYLLAHSGQAILQIQSWPLAPGQAALVLIVIALLPLAILGFTFPSIAGTLQFACACVGSRLAQDSSPAALLLAARISMGLALANLAIAMVRGLIDITPELFEAPSVLQHQPRALRKTNHPRRAA